MKGITITPETPNLIAIKSNMVILDKTPYRLATIQLDQINNTQLAHVKPIYFLLSFIGKITLLSNW